MHIQSSDPSSDDVLAALTAQVQHYRALAKLSVLQRDYIQNDQTEALLELLGQRETHVTQITSLEATVGPIKRNWAGFVAGLAPEKRRQAEVAMGETQRLLAELTAGDERDALALQQKKLRIGSEIKAASNAAVVNKRYAANAYGRSRSSQLDQKT